MKNVLVVSPHFPPVNTPDMHRVRLSLQYFQEFGWNATVLAVDSRYVEGIEDPLLLETLPAAVPVKRVEALPSRFTRRFGIGDLGLRSFASLGLAGMRILSGGRIDLVYFSTTVFTSMVLGRIWKRRFGTPFVLDIQDMWATDYYRSRPKSERPPKFWLADRVHRTLEPWTMGQADGVVAVAGQYLETLQERYPRLRTVPTKTVPFGAAEDDFQILKQHRQPNRFFQSGDGLIHGVYVGRGGTDMAPAARALFKGLRLGLDERPDLFSRIRLHLVGTSYASGGRAQKTFSRWAESAGVADRVDEHPARIPYFEALQLLKDSDFLVVPGSDDPQYTASKIYPYILARRPLLALFRPTSSVCDVLRHAGAGTLISVTGDAERDGRHLCSGWTSILARLPFQPHTDWDRFKPYLSRELTRQQCELFNQVLERRNGSSAAQGPSIALTAS